MCASLEEVENHWRKMLIQASDSQIIEMCSKLSSVQGFYLYLVKQIIFYPVAQTQCCKMLCCKCCMLAKTLSMYFTLPSVV